MPDFAILLNQKIFLFSKTLRRDPFFRANHEVFSWSNFDEKNSVVKISYSGSIYSACSV